MVMPFLEVKNPVNWHVNCSLRCVLHFFSWITVSSFFIISYVYHACVVTPNIVKLMCIAYFSLLSLIMMVFSVCVNVHLVHMLLFNRCLWLALFIMWLSYHLLLYGGYQCITKIHNRFRYFNRFGILTLHQLMQLRYLTDKLKLKPTVFFYGKKQFCSVVFSHHFLLKPDSFLQCAV